MKLNKNNTGKLTMITLSLMIFTNIFAFANGPRAFLLMGYSAIPWYLIAAVIFFIPYSLMVIEYGPAFKNKTGGIYSWMEDSVGTKYAFMGMFMWYCGFLIYLVYTANTVWIPLSNLLFGKDTTSTWSLLGLSSTKTIGLLAVAFLILLTFISIKGLRNVSKVASVAGIAISAIYAVFVISSVIVLIANKGNFAQPVNIEAFFHSPNPNYTSAADVLSFVTLAILAYVGVEIATGLVDKTENPETTFPKSIIFTAVLIAVGYTLSIFVCGIFTNWSGALSGKDVHLGNIAYILMINLGCSLGQALGLGEAVSLSIGTWMSRFFGLAMFLCMTGVSVSMVYSPLTQLIGGTPADIWPKKISKMENGTPQNAMCVQCLIAVAITLIMAFGGDSGIKFFNTIILMCSVSLTLPLMFVAGAFPSFKKKTEIAKPIVFYKSYKSSLIWTIIVVFSIGLANLITIIQPALSGDMVSSIEMAAGPLIFMTIGLLMYRRYNNITKKSQSNSNVPPTI